MQDGISVGQIAMNTSPKEWYRKQNTMTLGIRFPEKKLEVFEEYLPRAEYSRDMHTAGNHGKSKRFDFCQVHRR